MLSKNVNIILGSMLPHYYLLLFVIFYLFDLCFF